MLTVDRVRVTYSGVVALDEASLEVPIGSTSVVMGPSGCGKSTLLRVIAGLEQPEQGRVAWMSQPMDSVPPHKRGFGLMFQDYALFPHRSVGGNVAFGLRMAEWEAGAIDRRVTEVLELVGLDGYGDRSVGHLSGGEQQRVALARALAPSPKLLMLDEPIGALDRDLRSQLMTDMRRIFREVELTVLYVTHDQDEAFGLGDQIAVMRAGRVLRSGTPWDLWTSPGSAFTARFMGHENVLSVEEATRLSAAGHTPAFACAVTIFPGAIRLVPDPAGQAEVVETVFVAGTHRTTVSIVGIDLVAETAAPLPPGTTTRISVNPGGIITLNDRR